MDLPKLSDRLLDRPVKLWALLPELVKTLPSDWRRDPSEPMFPLLDPLPNGVVMFEDLDRSTPRLKIDAAPLLVSEVLNPLL